MQTTARTCANTHTNLALASKKLLSQSSQAEWQLARPKSLAVPLNFI